MLHEVVDVELWLTRLPLELLYAAVRGLPERMHPQTEAVIGPYDLAVNQQLHIAALAMSPPSQQVPTDVFVWHYGEPEQRAITKVGGLPYRPADKPWPLGKFGQPLSFVGQFCFTDSHDIVGALPGDVLLIFVDGEYGFDVDDLTSELVPPVFEWVLISAVPLISPDTLPVTNPQWAACYGARYRSIDYPDLDPFDYPEITEYVAVRHPATKIGGIPTWTQEGVDLPGRFLCQLPRVDPHIRNPYPFLNVPDPISYDVWRTVRTYDLGDLFLFLDADGVVHWSAQGD